MPQIACYFPFDGDLDDDSPNGCIDMVSPSSFAYSPAVRGDGFDSDGSSNSRLVLRDATGTHLPYDVSGALGVACWIRKDSATGNAEYVLSSAGQNAHSGFRLYFDSADVLRLRWHDGTSNYYECTHSIVGSTWYHVALSRDGSGSDSLRLFVNGQEVDSVVVPSVRNCDDGALNISKRRSNTNYGDITICQFVAVNRLLSQGDVQRLMLGMHLL